MSFFWDLGLRNDRRANEQNLIHRTLPPSVGVQILKIKKVKVNIFLQKYIREWLTQKMFFKPANLIILSAVSWLRRNHEIDTDVVSWIIRDKWHHVGSLYFVTAVLSCIILQVINFWCLCYQLWVLRLSTRKRVLWKNQLLEF